MMMNTLGSDSNIHVTCGFDFSGTDLEHSKHFIDPFHGSDSKAATAMLPLEEIGMFDSVQDEPMEEMSLRTSCVKSPTSSDQIPPGNVFVSPPSTASLCMKHRASPGRPSSASGVPGAYVEPSLEPCTDDIPWTDLVYWLGNSATGEVECYCESCMWEQNYARMEAARSYRRLSSKIPVIAMPRIEGVN